MIKCKKCQKQNQDHYKFCIECGAKLQKEVDNSNKTSSKKQKENIHRNSKNNVKYEYLLTIGKAVIGLSVIAVLFLGYSLLLLQTPLTENVLEITDSKLRVIIAFLLYFSILGTGIVSQAIYIKKTTGLKSAQIRMSTTFPFLLSFVPVGGIFMVGFFAYNLLKFQTLVGWMQFRRNDPHIAVATGDYDSVSSVKVGKNVTSIVGYLLIVSLFFQAFVIL